MTRIWLPIQTEGPIYVPCLDSKVHEAESRLKVGISGRKCGHQSPRLCVFGEAYGLNLETFGRAMSPPSAPPQGLLPCCLPGR